MPSRMPKMYLAFPGFQREVLWPRWAPEKKTAGDRSYYFIVFSSTRKVASNGPQLYVTPIVATADGQITTYSALYLWNQPEMENNHTPAWDTFELPIPQ